MMKVLLVEDNPGDARLTRELLAEGGPARFDVTHVERVSEALEQLARTHFDIILQDLSLPDGKGLEIVDRIQEGAPLLPIVVLSGFDDEALAVEAVQRGAQDYLVKGRGDGPLLARSIQYAIERKRSEERLAFLAQYDSLTGLANRTLFMDRVTQALARGKRSDRSLAMMFVDLDRFKPINDTLGHDVGDLLLKSAAVRLKGCVREMDTVARMGGDEFTILLESLASDQDVVICAQRILDAIAEPFLLEGHEVMISASIGMTVFPFDDGDLHSLLKHADIAMYRAKGQGGNTFQFYSADMSAKISEQLVLEQDLRRALARDEFLLYFQPQIDMQQGLLVGMEALLRWRHPTRGLVSPATFIPIAEETGLIGAIGQWVFRAAFEQTRAWQEQGLRPIRMAVNLSAHQFRQKDLAGAIARVLKDTNLEPGFVELEVTEGCLMDDTQAVLGTLAELKRMGLQISIDDFGTGYSSLRYLKTFPIDTLKIDQSFVRDVTTSPNDAAIAKAVIALGNSLGLGVIAEGVETQAQLEFLGLHGGTVIQGYLVSPPRPAEALLPWLRAGPLPAFAECVPALVP
jgi:diguanylate cyclase (GGDEF)-like protein